MRRWRLPSRIPARSMAVQSTVRATLNSIRLKSSDCQDGHLHIKSNLSKTIILPRNDVDDFSFDNNDIVVIKNMGGGKFTLQLTALKLACPYLIARSSRQSTKKIADGDKIKIVMQGGEALTVRANNALNPGGTTA
jgi:hypothetical protein